MNKSCVGVGVQNCSIDGFKRSVYPAAYLLIFVIGLVANLISLWFFLKIWRTQRTLSSVNLFMLNLNVSDLMLICSLPFRASYYINNSNWIFGDAICRIMSYIFYVNMYGSVYFLMALSVIRYVAINKPYTYKRQQNYRYSWLVCLSIWLLVSLASVPQLFSRTQPANSNTMRCLELLEPSPDLLNTFIIMNYGALLLGFLMPLLVILVCYMFVVHRLLRQNRAQANRHQYKKIFSLIIIVLVIFLACFLPYHVARSIFLQTEWDVCVHGSTSCRYIRGVRKAAVITHCLASANSCLDPLLYFFVGENFRNFWRRQSRKKPKIHKTQCRQTRDTPKTEMQQMNT
ncbi:hypothetical protein ACEWY4_008786 [Coilia grayii]|uniref:G-protein coupled receptors family 1 profile domain-containing protein n=1 Tax=Coilia grayii TaxID=363190 RepID=A0ABD1KBY6_9TELE